MSKTFDDTPAGAVRGHFQLWLSTLPQTQFRLFAATVLSFWTAIILTVVVGAQVGSARCQPRLVNGVVIPAGCQIQAELVYAWLGFIAALAGFSYLAYKTARNTDIDYNEAKKATVNVERAETVQAAPKAEPVQSVTPTPLSSTSATPKAVEVTENAWRDNRETIL